MKTREGVRGKAFGLDQPTNKGTSWRLTRRVKGVLEVRYGLGATAFAAAASIGWSLSELSEVPQIATEAAE